MKKNIFTALFILAVHIWTHGCQQKNVLVDRAVKEAVHNLHDTNEGIYCHGMMYRLLNMFWFKVDSMDEYQIREYGKLVFSIW